MTNPEIYIRIPFERANYDGEDILDFMSPSITVSGFTKDELDGELDNFDTTLSILSDSLYDAMVKSRNTQAN